MVARFGSCYFVGEPAAGSVAAAGNAAGGKNKQAWGEGASTGSAANRE